MSSGVVVGCDSEQEQLLPWWWWHYSRHNSYPVLFIDFGMSKQAVNWCQTKGSYQPLDISVETLKKVSPFKKKQWEVRLGKTVWKRRESWFKKPFACLQAPFLINSWIDLDCEIKGNLAPLFNFLNNGAQIAIARSSDAQEKNKKQNLIFPDEVTYNSGVVVFKKGAEIIKAWIDLSLHQNEIFIGDQDSLSRAIYLHHPPMVELPPIYNWVMNQKPSPNALILHYVSFLKEEILKELHFLKKIEMF